MFVLFLLHSVAFFGEMFKGSSSSLSLATFTIPFGRGERSCIYPVGETDLLL